MLRFKNLIGIGLILTAAAGQRALAQEDSVSAQRQTPVGSTVSSRQLSRADRAIITRMWKYTTGSSEQGLRIRARLAKRGMSRSAIDEFLDTAMDNCLNNYSGKHRGSQIMGGPAGLGIALTVPNLEPTYPRIGNPVPAYDLPRRALSANRGHQSYGLSAGDGAAISGTLIGFDMRQSADALARALTRHYMLYKKTVVAPRNVDAKQVRQTLQREREKLLELGGASAVKVLDKMLDVPESCTDTKNN